MAKCISDYRVGDESFINSPYYDDPEERAIDSYIEQYEAWLTQVEEYIDPGKLHHTRVIDFAAFIMEHRSDKCLHDLIDRWIFNQAKEAFELAKSRAEAMEEDR